MFSEIIVSWYRTFGRDLPWRHTRDAYAIWLSEIILQQTRIEQGRAYWERFMTTYPTVEALAAADEDEVLRLWQGLGYYSRARNLLVAARQVVALGGFPSSFEELRKLKGVGDYTAAAIGSFAFSLPVATVDGNVYRVLARHFGIDTPINTGEGKKLFSALAQELLPPKSAADFNQGMMDFGATLCTPLSPHCNECPLIETCVAFRTGRISEFPKKEQRLVVRERHLTYIYIRFEGKVALHRREARDIWQGLWEPFLYADTDVAAISASVSLQDATLVAEHVKHVLTHRILYADLYFKEAKEKPLLPDDYQWISEEELFDFAQPQLIKRLLKLL